MSGPASIVSSRSTTGMKIPKKGWRRTYYLYKSAFFDMLYSMMQAESDGDWNLFEWIVVVIVFMQDLAFCFITFNWGYVGHYFGFILSMTQIERALDTIEKSSVVYILAYL
ncbi:hypothetical protein HK098_005104, partial [Nowakowskiella sp. JEL0407]